MKRLAIALLVLASSAAYADGQCRLVDVSIEPVAHLQIAVWVEDAAGNFVDTVFVTRSTGALGLGNRPGNALFKSGFRWPYGRREMVLPVWAHARGKTYPYIVMGGAQGTDPHDDSIGYHEAYSSTENFYCPPSSAPLDAVSCASQFTGSKGVFAPDKQSVYPPRADLQTFTPYDSSDARTFASLNDVSAISGATPPGNQLLDGGMIRWAVPSTVPDGSYVIKVEASLEGDFNATNTHPSFPDYNQELRSFGRDVMGQPSVVWAVPVVVDANPKTAVVDGALGYGDWDGASGALHPMDGTISDAPGTGVGRLARVTDVDGTWQVKVFASGCQGCRTPQPPTAMSANPSDTSISLSFIAPGFSDALDRPHRYDIRYQPKVPLDDTSFASAIPADMPPPPGSPGEAQAASLTGLKAETVYYVGIRSINACGEPSAAAFTTATTQKQKFVVLHGCFIATAAFGSPMAKELDLLRAFRDRALLTNPLGELAVASYYALSPPIANAIASDERLRAGVRRALAPAVALARAFKLSEHRAR